MIRLERGWTPPPRLALAVVQAAPYGSRRRTKVLTPDYGTLGGKFTGQVNWVAIDVDQAALDAVHELAPEECLHLARAEQ